VICTSGDRQRFHVKKLIVLTVYCLDLRSVITTWRLILYARYYISDNTVSFHRQHMFDFCCPFQQDINVVLAFLALDATERRRCHVFSRAAAASHRQLGRHRRQPDTQRTTAGKISSA